MKPFFITLLAVTLSGPVTSFAAERSSEADMFGGNASATPGAKTVSESPAAAEPAAKSLKATFEENTQIGGTLSTEGDYYLQDGVPFLNNIGTNPNILFLYLDSKLENDARVFARTRLFYDPTGFSGGSFTTASLTNPYGFGTGTSDNLNISLQELRISANISHQKVKYGAAKFLNPTDFLNPTPFNFFLPSDERPGVDMVKMHIPSGTANFYVAGLTGNPTTGSQTGGYFRSEIAYDGVGGLLDSGEISLSGILPKGQFGKAGFDISQAVGELDVYFEGAMGQDTAGNWKDAYSTGLSWQARYADRESNTITFQAEYDKVGSLLDQGVFSLFLPGPGSLQDITFVETNLYSFLDQSGLSRLDTVCQFSERISGRVYVSGHWGQLGGVFHMPGQLAETGTRLDVSF